MTFCSPRGFSGRSTGTPDGCPPKRRHRLPRAGGRSASPPVRHAITHAEGPTPDRTAGRNRVALIPLDDACAAGLAPKRPRHRMDGRLLPGRRAADPSCRDTPGRPDRRNRPGRGRFGSPGASRPAGPACDAFPLRTTVTPEWDRVLLDQQLRQWDKRVAGGSFGGMVISGCAVVLRNSAGRS